MLYAKKLLLPVFDLTQPPRSALTFALYAADYLSASLEVLYVGTSVSGSDWERLRQWTEEAARAHGCRLHDHADKDGARPPLGTGLRVNVLAAAEPAAAATAYADDHDHDLLILRLDPTHAAHPWVLHVFRHAQASTLTLPAGPRTDELRPWRHLLVPIDFSDNAQHALVHAKELAGTLNARLTLLHVLPTRPPALHAAHDTPAFFNRQLRGLLQTVPGPSVPGQAYVVQGVPHHAIAEQARRLDADLILTSSHGLTGFKQFNVGQVTRRLVPAAHCPVFTVKTFGRSLSLTSPQDFQTLPYVQRSPRHTRSANLPATSRPLTGADGVTLAASRLTANS